MPRSGRGGPGFESQRPDQLVMDRLQVTYKGSVQGVGFRFTVNRVASQIGITGFVQNLPDGGVLTVCEGKRWQLESFLESITDEMGNYIRNSQVDWQPATGEFKSFGIKF